MIKINPNVEILYDDLIDLNVGEFLISRDFKRMIKKLKFEHGWNTVKKHAEKQRTFIATNFDHEEYDSKNALVHVLNHLDKDESIKKFLVNLILNFIAFKSKRSNFKNLIESLDLLGFEDQYQNEIYNQVSLHEMKYPENEKKTPKPKEEMERLEKKTYFYSSRSQRRRTKYFSSIIGKSRIRADNIKRTS